MSAPSMALHFEGRTLSARAPKGASDCGHMCFLLLSDAKGEKVGVEQRLGKIHLAELCEFI